MRRDNYTEVVDSLLLANDGSVKYGRSHRNDYIFSARIDWDRFDELLRLWEEEIVLSDLAYRSFRVYFNHRSQWFDVYLYDVSPETFQRRDAGRWGFFDRTDNEQPIAENKRSGKFGELHLIDSHIRQLRSDTVAHELMHLLFEWLRVKNVVVTTRNEEAICNRYDELVRNFWRTYHQR